MASPHHELYQILRGWLEDELRACLPMAMLFLVAMVALICWLVSQF